MLLLFFCIIYFTLFCYHYFFLSISFYFNIYFLNCIFFLYFLKHPWEVGAMWFQSQWAQQQQQTCRPPRRAAAGASEAGKKKDKKKKKNPTSCKESRRRSTSASPLWMSNQLHDSEGGPLFRIKHCNLIMCGLIKGPCVRPQPCTASSTWLDSEIPQGGGGRKEEKKELSSLVFSTRQRRLPPGLAVYLVSASRGVVETLATLRLAATARCLLDKGG